ncbi:hypothetical protein ACIP2Y_43955 [Streptomyces sviceus]
MLRLKSQRAIDMRALASVASPDATKRISDQAQTEIFAATPDLLGGRRL